MILYYSINIINVLDLAILNLTNPFFEILQETNFDYVYNDFYIKDDIHFNEKGNKINF